jgi:VWFA-related protein
MTQPGLVLRAESRLVVVEVTVKDRRGRPDQDLKQSDFKVFENGKPQRIVAFEHHAFAPQPAAAAAALPLPKGEYSNVHLGAASLPALNIILFDVLNSEMAAQMDGRRQMVQFLKTLPPGQPTALFELSDVLKMLAGFSSNSDQLRAAAEKLLPYKSPSYVSEWEAEQDAAVHNDLLPHGAAPLQGAALEAFIENARAWGLRDPPPG